MLTPITADPAATDARAGQHRSPTDRGDIVATAEAPASQLRLVSLDTVMPRPVDWLWANRIPVGKLTMLVGDPGAGKTFVTLAIASALTRGRRLPDDPRKPGEPERVLILNFEDGTEDTIRPRAEMAGCDLSRTIVIEGVAESDRQVPFTAHHVNLLDGALERMPDVRLLVIDPIAQLLGRANTTQDNEVRIALQPLKELAERRNIAVVCIVHLRKAAAENAMYRVSGSVAFVGFARSVLLVAKDSSGRHSISRIKGNLSQEPAPVEFAIDDEGVFSWRGTAPELCAENMLSLAKRLRTDEVSEFLRHELADGPRLARELYTLGKDRGFSEDKLKRARKACGLEVTKEPSPRGRWSWSLPREGISKRYRTLRALRALRALWRRQPKATMPTTPTTPTHERRKSTQAFRRKPNLD
jgi:archaellum biogenesis ATPase FlaH